MPQVKIFLNNVEVTDATLKVKIIRHAKEEMNGQSIGAVNPFINFEGTQYQIQLPEAIPQTAQIKFISPDMLDEATFKKLINNDYKNVNVGDLLESGTSNTYVVLTHPLKRYIRTNWQRRKSEMHLQYGYNVVSDEVLGKAAQTKFYGVLGKLRFAKNGLTYTSTHEIEDGKPVFTKGVKVTVHTEKADFIGAIKADVVYQQVQHAHAKDVTTFETYNEEQSRTFYTTERTQKVSVGVTLDKLDPRTLSFSKKIDIVYSALEKLKKFHKYGVIHHDIKLENIVVNPDTLECEFIDIDFGKLSSEKSNNTVGTLGYLSPENYFELNTTTASDVFSLGCTFYYFLFPEALQALNERRTLPPSARARAMLTSLDNNLGGQNPESKIFFDLISNMTKIPENVKTVQKPNEKDLNVNARLNLVESSAEVLKQKLGQAYLDNFAAEAINEINEIKNDDAKLKLKLCHLYRRLNPKQYETFNEEINTHFNENVVIKSANEQAMALFSSLEVIKKLLMKQSEIPIENPEKLDQLKDDFLTTFRAMFAQIRKAFNIPVDTKISIMILQDCIKKLGIDSLSNCKSEEDILTEIERIFAKVKENSEVIFAWDINNLINPSNSSSASQGQQPLNGERLPQVPSTQPQNRSVVLTKFSDSNQLVRELKDKIVAAPAVQLHRDYLNAPSENRLDDLSNAAKRLNYLLNQTIQSEQYKPTIIKALDGILNYLNRDKKHLGFFSKIFDSNTGVERAKRYIQMIYNAKTDLERLLIIRSIFAERSSSQLKIDVQRSLNFHFADDAARKLHPMIDQLQKAPLSKNEEIMSGITDFLASRSDKYRTAGFMEKRQIEKSQTQAINFMHLLTRAKDDDQRNIILYAILNSKMVSLKQAICQHVTIAYEKATPNDLRNHLKKSLEAKFNIEDIKELIPDLIELTKDNNYFPRIADVHLEWLSTITNKDGKNFIPRHHPN